MQNTKMSEDTGVLCPYCKHTFIHIHMYMCVLHNVSFFFFLPGGNCSLFMSIIQGQSLLILFTLKGKVRYKGKI